VAGIEQRRFDAFRLFRQALDISDFAPLDAAKAAFRASYDGYQAWSVTDVEAHTIDDAVAACLGIAFAFALGVLAPLVLALLVLRLS
jgi:hypothetical protein